MALGNASLTPLTLANGYSRIANGGYAVNPFLIDYIEDYEGNIIFQATPKTVCHNCANETDAMSDSQKEVTSDTHQETSQKIDATDKHPPKAQRIADERAIYILHSMLKDVITLGTGRRALSLNRTDLAGKTGTTNDQKDAWFSGFNTQLQTTVWVGFDQPSSLGRREYGASAALPIWVDYMSVALKDQPAAHMLQPDGIVTARIDKKTGEIALPGAANSMFEIYRKENVPIEKQIEAHTNTGEGNIQTLSPEDIY